MFILSIVFLEKLLDKNNYLCYNDKKDLWGEL